MEFLHISSEHPDAPAPGSRVGILLINLGTPDDTNYAAVRRYLSEFLSDQRVIEANPAIWQPILQGVVLTVRPGKSGKAYGRIWNRERDESPLRTFSRAQAELLAERFRSENVSVAWGMRYGTPSIADAATELMQSGCDRIVAMALYPQYSATTTATANDQLFRFLMKIRRQPAIRTLAPFPDDPVYIDALASTLEEALAGLPEQPQVVVTSFHGLPKDYVRKGDSYQADCERTVVALRERLGKTSEEMPLTFQSRFGPAKWLEPYTAPFVAALPAQGIRRVAIMTPGFMVDCLETLDELGNEVRHEFMAAGGEELTLIPCLNACSQAIDLLEYLARSQLQGWV
ncbi:ferrochelatase [Acetobacter conturbans]|uniref:Ferrochelatase n=1 Tax=Acetobacter conturbans TaxID=1737472 RepID=A0ABX0K0J0_9PROT|nr:ferrochelatase [Acetobacter conturbans]NHN88662.1 ferrochelatase [Acetobacter conturbans]